MDARTRRQRAAVPRLVGANARRLAVGLLVASALAAGGGIGHWAEVSAAHNTCQAINQAGGEAAMEAHAKATLDSRLPQSYSGKVTVGKVPVTNDPIRVDVDATIKKPAKSVNITCASSTFSTRVDIRAKVSGRAGSSTHEGDGRITGHYFVYLANPPRVCVKNLKMASLNLEGVQNDVDNWIRKKINDSIIVQDICSQ
jgi:hypothetical protein